MDSDCCRALLDLGTPSGYRVFSLFFLLPPIAQCSIHSVPSGMLAPLAALTENQIHNPLPQGRDVLDRRAENSEDTLQPRKQRVEQRLDRVEDRA